MTDDMDMQYDENEAIKFIRNYMPAEIGERYTDDEILNILDMIWDYYEDHGLLEINVEADAANASDELPQLMEYVKKTLMRDKLAIVDTDDVHYIVEGELAYEKSIGMEED